MVDWSLFHLNAMTSVLEPDGTTSVWAVGDDGLIFRMSQMGSIGRIDSPEREKLYDVDFVSSDNGWSVGANGLIMHWNGTDWQVSKPAEESRWPYSSDLYRVAFTDANDGWAAGCTGSEGGEYFLVYHWDGISWKEVSLSNERNLWACVHDIATFSSTDVWMVGTTWREGKEYGITVHWNGSEWAIISELSSYKIYSLSALSSDNIWAITGNGIVLYWNGVEWKEQVKLEAANIIFAQNTEDVFAIGTKIWYWDGGTWTDLSASSNFPADVEIKAVMAPYLAESGFADVWMLDVSGRIFTFNHPRTRRV